MVDRRRGQQPWRPAEATEQLRRKAKEDFNLYQTRHAKEQMEQRGLIIGDVLHVLSFGFVYEDPQAATQAGYYKYRMECPTPNSGGRSVRVVVIPSEERDIKLVTVMWVDEDARKN